jgi:ubiquinone/menaquinone biosynthesis C-methylase UbiE
MESPRLSDRSTYDLLRQLNTTDTPTFRDLTIPPRTVLDLGCGEGHWILEAAATWGYDDGTLFIGFDLVDVFTEYVRRQKLGFDNVEFVRGNLCVHINPAILR